MLINYLYHSVVRAGHESIYCELRAECLCLREIQKINNTEGDNVISSY